MRIHVIGTDRNPSTTKVPMDCYAMVSYYLTTYLHRAGHEVHYYGYKESTVECNKKWECANEDDWNNHQGIDSTNANFTESPVLHDIFFANARDHLVTNCNDGEIILCMWSSAVRWIKDAINTKYVNVKIVDAHVGHYWPEKDTSYHVFASNANKHFCYGKHDNRDTGYWQDTVIYPMANDLNNFKYNEDKDDYFLFMGRLQSDKGIDIFISLAKHFPNKKFKVAGKGLYTYEELPNVEFLGLVGIEDRKKYLSNAKAVISPSHYAEPFGLTAVEASLSGTPIITTDYGGYCETVIDKVTGFRCSYWNDFVNAINNIETIKPKDCRNHGEQFSAESLIKDWERYLHRINRNGWYDLDEQLPKEL